RPLPRGPGSPPSRAASVHRSSGRTCRRGSPGAPAWSACRHRGSPGHPDGARLRPRPTAPPPVLVLTCELPLVLVGKKTGAIRRFLVYKGEDKPPARTRPVCDTVRNHDDALLEERSLSSPVGLLDRRSCATGAGRQLAAFPGPQWHG